MTGEEFLNKYNCHFGIYQDNSIEDILKAMNEYSKECASSAFDAGFDRYICEVSPHNALPSFSPNKEEYLKQTFGEWVK